MRLLKFLITLLFFVAVLTGCRSGTDIIAEMKSGHITRDEFHRWLESRGVSPDSIYSDRKTVIANLRQMSVEKIALQKALSEKFDQTPLFSSVIKAVYSNYLSSFYKERIKQNLDFNEKAAELSIIKLSFKPQEKVNEKEAAGLRNTVYADKKELSKYIIRELKSGRSFKKLAEKFSEDPSSSKGGNIGVYPLIMIGKNFSSSISSFAEGEFTATPVETENTFIVAKVEKWHSLNRNNSAGVIENKELYNKFIDLLASERIEYITAERGSALDIKSYLNKAEFRTPSDILFSINGEFFTVKEFDCIMGIFRFFKPEINNQNNNSLQEKRRECEVLMNERIIAMIAEMDGYGRDPEFVKKWNFVRDGTLAGSYKYDNLLKFIELKRKEFSDSLAAPCLLNSAYSKCNPAARDKIISELKNSMESDLLSDNNFFIREDALF